MEFTKNQDQIVEKTLLIWTVVAVLATIHQVVFVLSNSAL